MNLTKPVLINRTIDKRVTVIGFVLAVALITVIGVFMVRNLRLQQIYDDRVSHTQLVMFQLQDLLTTLQDAELSQRREHVGTLSFRHPRF